MTASEYQIWLSTLTFEQRQAVEMAVGVVMDSLLMLEGRMAKSEKELQQLNILLAETHYRIDELERRVNATTSGT